MVRAMSDTLNGYSVPGAGTYGSLPAGSTAPTAREASVWKGVQKGKVVSQSAVEAQSASG
ncbi:hypothetical protein GCM10009540_78290 [Streptomyces turgidiscabies]